MDRREPNLERDLYLIGCVRSRPMLWQISHSQFGDNKAKRNEWTLIAASSGGRFACGDMARNRWMDIRWEYMHCKWSGTLDPNGDYEKALDFMKNERFA